MNAKDEQRIGIITQSDGVIVLSPDGQSEIKIQWVSEQWMIRAGRCRHLIISPVSNQQINVRTRWPGQE